MISMASSRLSAFFLKERNSTKGPGSLEAVTAQLQRQKEYAARLEDEKSQIREECAAVQDKMQAEIDTREATIEFLQRRYDQPKDYDGIAAWVEEHFSDPGYSCTRKPFPGC